MIFLKIIDFPLDFDNPNKNKEKGKEKKKKREKILKMQNVPLTEIAHTTKFIMLSS